MQKISDQQRGTPSSADSAVTPERNVSRFIIRGSVLMIAACMIVDALPNSWTGDAFVKRAVSGALGRVGLWQGEWSMFAPDPVINNGWVTVQMRTSNGQTIQRDSPLWSEKNTIEKFVGFRHVNYYNRLVQPWNIAATDDFMAYLARLSPEPVVESKLFRNQLKLRMPDDRTLPNRVDAEWQFSSELWAQRNVEP